MIKLILVMAVASLTGANDTQKIFVDNLRSFITDWKKQIEKEDFTATEAEKINKSIGHFETMLDKPDDIKEDQV